MRLKSHLQYFNVYFCHCERAQRASVATNRQGILMILALHTVDCFALLAMTIGISCHVERSETSLAIPIFVSFVKGDRGATCEAPPLSPLTIPQTPSRFLEVCAPHGLCHAPQRFVYVNTRTLPLCAVVGTLRLKSNGESKIAESKARLCMASP